MGQWARIKLWCADCALLITRTFGGSGGESVTAIATDRDGFVIAAGSTSSYDFPVTDGSHSPCTYSVR